MCQDDFQFLICLSAQTLPALLVEVFHHHPQTDHVVNGWSLTK